MDREAYRKAIVGLLLLQKELKHPPERVKISSMVHALVKEFELKHDPRREYFVLLATCALLGREPMYNGFEPKKKLRRKHEN